MDEINKKIIEAYLNTVVERKFDLGSGTKGNGVVIWNRAREVHGDYEKVAHIDQNRKVTYYVKNPPKEVRDYVDKIAKGKNFASTTTQPHMKVFKESLDEASQIEFTEMDKGKQKFVTDLVGKSNVDKQQFFSGINGTIVSFNSIMPGRLRIDKNTLKKILNNKDVRWIDIVSIGMDYNKNEI